MIALMNETPNFCPKCGHGLARAFTDGASQQDFFLGASHSCPQCAMQFGYARGKNLLAVVEDYSDMRRYASAADKE